MLTSHDRSDCIDHGKRGNRDGYLPMRYKGKVQQAHRVAYCEARQIPIEYIKGSVIRHTCDNPRCINPRHLLIGTPQDNSSDMVERNRQAKGTSNGRAVLTESDVRYIREHCVKGCREFGNSALARRFGVSHQLISDVVNYKLWAHVK